MKRDRDAKGPKLFYDVQVDLHGLFAEDALKLVERTVFANPSCSILVIHGRGSGVLRKTIRDALRQGRIARVREFRLGEEINAPGLDGVTIIYS
jgi:dsDNA-specific endonuclease/ATPase MutS2